MREGVKEGVEGGDGDERRSEGRCGGRRRVDETCGGDVWMRRG